MRDELRVIHYDAAPSVAFGPLSDYRPLIGDDCSDLAVRTGIQICRPGYAARPHWHPYVEILHILDGAAEAWQTGREQTVALRPGDTIVIPARTWHSFRVVGEQTLRLLGTHLSNQRIVHFDDGSTTLGARPLEDPPIGRDAPPSAATDAPQAARTTIA